MSEKKYDSSDKSNLSFQVGGDTLDLMLLYADLLFFHV